MKMLDYANQHIIPVWTELKLLDFIKNLITVLFK